MDYTYFEKELKEGQIIMNDYIACEDGNRPIVRAIKIQHGLKIHISKNSFEEMIKNEDIVNNYRLNTVKLNDELYSVYFKGKEHLETFDGDFSKYNETVGVSWC